MSEELNDEEIHDDYGVVTLRLHWGAVSILLFLATLPAKHLTRFLWHATDWRPSQIWIWPLIPWALVLLFALLGAVAGCLGLTVSEHKTASKIGLLLNGVVLGCMVLVLAGIYYVRYVM